MFLARWGSSNDPFCSSSMLIAIILSILALNSLISTSEALQRHEQITGGRDRPLNSPRQYIKTHPCERSSCYPATGNLLIGRENRLKASSTCGLHGWETFCILSNLEGNKCYRCDTREETRNNPFKYHGIEQIYKTEAGTWWQSENGKENVTIQLDLEAEFHFTHLIITFTTFRPAAMLIERSYDFGQTWHVYRYFAYNCEESFPGVPTILRNITDVMCTSRYSNVEPSRGGEVIFKVLPPNINVSDPYSIDVQNVLKITNLRINFTKLHKLGDNLLDNRAENLVKYYYGINNMVVRGSCSCYGHASQCLPLDTSPNAYYNPDMVHGRCECTHNTKGLNCESCEDFYNDVPWKPAFGKQTNACKKCECNEHAISCHFDRHVFDASGQRSGGVCDNCQHNTEGQHCERCMDYFYRDPNANSSSPFVCQPCNCDHVGSIDDGICDSVNDPENGIEAGACHCKANLKGRRCDTCKDGYWNLTPENPEGCQKCTCNTLGTVNNSGCNMYTGDCTCKRLVTGKDCNQCALSTFGLSDTEDGCTPCDCDAGGSENNYCDVITGDCTCRPHMTGRTCSQPKQNYFIPQLDIVHEAEVSDACYAYGKSGKCSTVPYQIESDSTPDFTGHGYKRLPENSELVITVDDIPTSMPYDVVLRYNPTTRGDWEDAFISLVRPDEIDPLGECAAQSGSSVYETRVPFNLPERQRQVVALQGVCLEAGKMYKFKIHFERRRHNEDNPTATILIDSLVIIPRIEVTPVFNGSPDAIKRLDDYSQFGCNQSLYDLRYRDNINDRCKELENYVSKVVYNGASMCNCDATGSLSKECETNGGFCHCKPNVVGRQCNQCAHGTYGFGPEGCSACDCNNIGSKDNNCDLITGQCVCHPNTYGRECNECQPGYWNFPDCQACECNGHARLCHPDNGQCLDCMDFTTGYRCDSCLDGYYGDPYLGSEIGCRPCRCPDTIASGNNHADDCSLDVRNNNMVCHCKEGYEGARCEMCADNFFGDAENPGGSCEKCNCSNNVDLYNTGNCDRYTGQCKKCLYDTTGDHCELCRDGFHGNALQQNCVACDCDKLGTNSTIEFCNRFTGQCPCLPNVVGIRCDECAENHWKIASGTGCEQCGCDPIGASSDQCHRFTGQCYCREGFGGLACNECQAGYWGNPNEKCQPCDCNASGSAAIQCDRGTGQCVCHQGIGGYKCDECARGYIGNFPLCTACGECFDNWDIILKKLDGETAEMIKRAKEIKQIGATGAYTAEFDALDKKLQNIKELLANNTISLNDIDNFNKEANDLKEQLAASNKTLLDTENELGAIHSALSLSAVELETLQNQSALVKKLSKELNENGIVLQESNIEGALNLTRRAYDRILDLAEVKDQATKYANNTERNCKRVDMLLKDMEENAFTLVDNEKLIDDYRKELSQMTSFIPSLNNDVCDKNGDPCDNLCGGAGCGSCGGLSCEHGALTRTEQALKIATDTENIIKEKKEHADQTLRSLSQAQVNASEAYQKAKTAYENAEIYLNYTSNKFKLGEDLKDKLTDYINNNTALPSESKELAQKTLQLDLTLDPQEIQTLGVKINDAVSSLKNVESIIYNTRNDLERVNALQATANTTKEKANIILANATTVVKNLDVADESQITAQDAIQQANGNIQLAITDLNQIDIETSNAGTPANSTANQVNELAERVTQLQKHILENELDAKSIKLAADEVKFEALSEQALTNNLQNDYNTANNSLSNRALRSEIARERAKSLLQRASKLTVDTKEKLAELDEMQQDYLDKNNRLQKLQNDIEPLSIQLDTYLKDIQMQSEKYRQCTD